MSLALVHGWKEWRSQRGVLVAYTLMAWLGLALTFTMVPEHWWLEDGRGALALAWFVAVGAIGVVAFAAPGLVRAEFASKQDQFVRRLPGALGPSFRGKLLFLGLAAVALPLLSLAAGELVLTALGHEWSDLWQARWTPADGGGWAADLVWPWPVLGAGVALLVVPWVWTLGTWLPSGRMALGGALLFWLVAGLVLFAVERQCHAIEQGLVAWPWVAAAVALGFVAAGTSWVVGRRGGGAWRSARVGLATVGAGLAGPALWLGDRVHEYHHPDLATVRVQNVVATTPDRRFVLAYGAARDGWNPVPLRIDLHDGSAAQVGGIHEHFTKATTTPWSHLERGAARFVRHEHAEREQFGIFDLATGTDVAVPYDRRRRQLVTPAGLLPDLVADLAATTSFRGPEGLVVFALDGELWFRAADGSTTRVPWDGKDDGSLLVAAGHGLSAHGSGGRRLYDFVRRRRVDTSGLGACDGFGVRGVWVVLPHKGGHGHQRIDAATGAREPLPELRDCRVLGLLDDTWLLAKRHTGIGKQRRFVGLFRYDPHTRTEQPIVLPAEVTQLGSVFAPGSEWGSWLPRDPEGGTWIAREDHEPNVGFLRLAVDGSVALRTLPLADARHHHAFAWDDAEHLLVVADGRLERRAVAGAGREVLFPRAQR
jgi:hypothetical protein